ncbi:S8 family serine peptidase [uncultured Shewanella sp.]|uniref:S8 family serine peptidase n=1 Tax=Shewanella atlantica TaxID=271099 RepID=UPI0026270D54|nr:S8 family serine peptidase [uncultured Shewanella sp.]
MTNSTKVMIVLCILCLAIVSGGLAAGEQRYIVKFKPGAGAKGAAQLSAIGARQQLELHEYDAAAFTIPSNALKGLQHNPNIEYIEPDAKRYLLSQTIPYGIPMVQADQLSDSAAGNMTVCIIDSGYQRSHEDLPGSGTVNGASDDGGAGDWFVDEVHHGTHVAGTIAALNNSVGVLGITPNDKLNLFIVKVFDASGWAYSSSLVAALGVCEDNGANVINMSLGGSFKSRTEERAFTAAHERGVLSIAAAGNDGNTRHSYPASYRDVISVAAVDENKQHASFSQRTSQVELAAPGVHVLSPVPMETGLATTTLVAGAEYSAIGMGGSPLGTESGVLIDCGLGDSQCNDAAGAVCLIQRGGNIAFSDKVLACEDGGGIAAIIYNNVSGSLSGTLGEVVTHIPSVGVSKADGEVMLGLLGSSATVSLLASNYAYFDGTSMATPHVAGVAALVWSHHLACTNTDIRDALRASAEDLGVTGRDDYYGYGLVQAREASLYLGTDCGASAGGGGADGGGNDKPEKPCRGRNCP